MSKCSDLHKRYLRVSHAERLKLISEIRRGIELLGENFDLEAYDDSDPERESRENTTS